MLLHNKININSNKFQNKKIRKIFNTINYNNNNSNNYSNNNNKINNKNNYYSNNN